MPWKLQASYHMTMQCSLEVPWPWQGCHKPGNHDHDPVKLYWMPSTYQVPTYLTSENLRQTHKNYQISPGLNSLGGKWACAHKTQDPANLLPILEAHLQHPACHLPKKPTWSNPTTYLHSWHLQILLSLFLSPAHHRVITHVQVELHIQRSHLSNS